MLPPEIAPNCASDSARFLLQIDFAPLETRTLDRRNPSHSNFPAPSENGYHIWPVFTQCRTSRQSKPTHSFRAPRKKRRIKLYGASWNTPHRVEATAITNEFLPPDPLCSPEMLLQRGILNCSSWPQGKHEVEKRRACQKQVHRMRRSGQMGNSGRKDNPTPLD